MGISRELVTFPHVHDVHEVHDVHDVHDVHAGNGRLAFSLFALRSNCSSCAQAFGRAVRVIFIMLTQGFALGYDLSPLPHPKNRKSGAPWGPRYGAPSYLVLTFSLI
jgi:hypothetical protein